MGKSVHLKHLRVDNPEEVGFKTQVTDIRDTSGSPLSREMKQDMGSARAKLSNSVAVTHHALTADGKRTRNKSNHPNSTTPALALLSMDQMPPVIKSFMPNQLEKQQVNKYVGALSSRLAIPKNNSNGSLKSLNAYMQSIEHTSPTNKIKIQRPQLFPVKP